MRALGATALALLAALGAQDAGRPDWPAVWTRLAALREAWNGGAGDPAAWRPGLAGLEEIAAAHRGEFEGELLAAHLAEIGGAGRPRLDAALVPEAYRSADEAWLAGRVLAPGVARARAWAQAVTECADADLQGRLFPAFRVFEEDATALRLEDAAALGEALHARAGMTWSAQSLALLYRRMGRYADADAVLVEQLARTEEPADQLVLLQDRAITACGAGWEARADDLLGEAFALGGRDACQILGLRALSAGDRGRARRLFRYLLLPRSGQDRRKLLEGTPWALRGWGLALLPPR